MAMGSVRPHSPCPVYLTGNGSLFIHCAYYGEAARTSPSLRADRWGRFQALPTFPHNGINVDLCGSYNKVVRRHKSSLMESACIRTAILAQVEQCCVCIGLLESWFSPFGVGAFVGLVARVVMLMFFALCCRLGVAAAGNCRVGLHSFWKVPWGTGSPTSGGRVSVPMLVCGIISTCFLQDHLLWPIGCYAIGICHMKLSEHFHAG